ncbi:MAG: hypothetical protein HY363_01950 [Candidatus Aenigmarchaeota archaeon]|nr:hypothetical protein [Candidatus Aenigmarchaeota archaeon]
MLETVFAVIVFLLAGILCSKLAAKNIFFVPATLLAGIVLSAAFELYLPFNHTFLATIGFVSYVSILLFTSHKPQLHRLDVQQKRAFRLFIAFSVIFVFALSLLFINNLQAQYGIAVFFALTLCATTLPKIKLPSRVHEILTHERNYTALLSLVAPILAVPFFQNIPLSTAVSTIGQYAMSLVLGIGVGVFTGVIFSKILVHHQREDTIIAVLLLLLAGFLTFILSERLNSFGPLSVAALGLFLSHAPRRSTLERKHESELNHLFVTYAVLGTGMLLSLPASKNILLLTLLLAAIFYAARIIATYASIGTALSMKEKLMLTFFSPVGPESLVLLLYFTTILLPLGITAGNLLTLSQATILLVFTTHLISVIGVILKIR